MANNSVDDPRNLSPYNGFLSFPQKIRHTVSPYLPSLSKKNRMIGASALSLAAMAYLLAHGPWNPLGYQENSSFPLNDNALGKGMIPSDMGHALSPTHAFALKDISSSLGSMLPLGWMTNYAPDALTSLGNYFRPWIKSAGNTVRDFFSSLPYFQPQPPSMEQRIQWAKDYAQANPSEQAKKKMLPEKTWQALKNSKEKLKRIFPWSMDKVMEKVMDKTE